MNCPEDELPDDGPGGAGARPSAAAAEHLPDPGHVDQLHMPLAHLDQSCLGETREQPADRLQLQAQVAADFLAAHPQHELAGRVAARREALGQIDEDAGPLRAWSPA